ncbi:hypothetical protein BKI52_31860 [marine bacterium AO1-C]|nr:hypothetical protein BKI52_31860 [marine bacterium AO1-C]
MKNRLNFTLKPENLVVELLNTAEHYYEQGSYELATSYYTQVIALEPTQANLTYALYMRGMAHYECGEHADALIDWQQAQDLGFEHPWGIDLMELIK